MTLVAGSGLVVSLDSPEALDPAIVGVKAAGLAAARQRGLPVLPGVVVPVAAGRAAIELGVRTLEAEGPGRARLVVDRFPVDDELAATLEAAAAQLGDPLIVRSSTTLDGDGRWSGAFNSIGHVRPDEVAGALRGCWSSVFRPDALKRFDLTGVEPRDIGMAVLLQRQLRPSCGGMAEVDGDGRVSIWAAAGAPGPLLAGLSVGVRGSIGQGGEVDGALDGLPVDRSALAALSGACLEAHGELGANRFEWAIEAGQPWILQLDRTADDRTGALVQADDSEGRTFRGFPASPGRAAGRAIHLGPGDLNPAPDVSGAILVVDDPLPVFAPLLWQAIGLVALRGNAAAHLCGVARSLHVPAVVGLLSFDQNAGRSLETGSVTVVVDGESGTVGL